MSLSPFFVSWSFSSKAILGGYNVGGRKGGGEKTPEKAVLSKSFLPWKTSCGVVCCSILCDLIMFFSKKVKIRTGLNNNEYYII